MAKFHNYHILCPLIDQNSFLGVAPDREDEHVLITLGRNVVNIHRLSDQKQISGWTSKDHITAPVIYDTEQNSYVGVFNNNTIKTWMDEGANLDKLKKYKFPINILKLVSRENQPPLVIFSNGNCASLPYALENRKTYESKFLLKDTDEVIDAAPYQVDKKDFICFIMKTKECYEIVFCPIRDELGDIERSKLVRVKVIRDGDLTVVGKLITVSIEKCCVYILWSDSKMSVYTIQSRKWKSVGTVPWISTSSSVSMAWMRKRHLIMFGSNKDQEGAIIIAYNYILGVGSCKYPMKMYRENAKLYCYDSRIILEASNHIGMLPFTLEIKRNISRLLGSHEIIQNDSPQIADWGSPTEPLYKASPEMAEAVRLGITERSVCEKIVPALLEKEDSEALIRVMREFKDIPESALAALVKYAVTSHIPQSDDVNCELLNEIFRVLFCDVLLIPVLRNSLAVKDSLNLLKYILYLLFECDLPLDADYESRLYDWCALILDAFYQQYIISTDPDVVVVLDHLSKYLTTVVKQLFTVSDMIAQLHKLLSGKSNTSYDDELPYTIELMQI